MRRRTIAPVLALLAAVVLAGCTAAEPPGAAPPALTHVHALAVDPDRDALLVATHSGIHRVGLRGTPAGIEGPLGDLDVDAMGFAVAGGVMYASGHPGPRTPESFGSPNLGLIRSDDAGATWTTESLRGAADFHGLTVSDPLPNRVYGLEGTLLRRSDDGGRTWSDLAVLEARTVLASADDADTVYATTAEGLLVSSDAGSTFGPVPDAPTLYLLADRGSTRGGLAGIDTEGTVWIQDGGEWVSGGQATGTPQALLVLRASGRLIVADDRGIVASDDAGATWEVLWAL